MERQPVKHRVATPMFASLATMGLLLWQVSLASQVSRSAQAQDPGPRGGAAGAGDAIAGLAPYETPYFLAGKGEFDESETVAEGLGPRMNLDSCVGCHSQPASGGSSPAINPQVEFATGFGLAKDHVPSFISADGPVREARFVRNADGSPDGGVHALFTITGRGGETGCSLNQPDFAGAMANRNVVFRIPTPTFGAGLIEQIPDSTIVANGSSNAAIKSALGIRGRPNFQVSGRTVSGQTNNNGNDGTIARFGWKAQNKSLLMFAGEAYNVEMGISNELFQTERDETASCQYAQQPNSTTDASATSPIEALSAIEKFAFFMRFLAPPVPSTTLPNGATSIASGKDTFVSVGCAQCHTPSMMTGDSVVPALRNQPVNLFSDLLIHDMGNGLADGVSQGEAGPREFRTAPLWGLGQRLYFLHDGRATNLTTAISAHSSSGSEANAVISNYNKLNETKKQDLLNFLRSL